MCNSVLPTISEWINVAIVYHLRVQSTDYKSDSVGLFHSSVPYRWSFLHWKTKNINRTHVIGFSYRKSCCTQSTSTTWCLKSFTIVLIVAILLVVPEKVPQQNWFEFLYAADSLQPTLDFCHILGGCFCRYFIPSHRECVRSAEYTMYTGERRCVGDSVGLSKGHR